MSDSVLLWTLVLGLATVLFGVTMAARFVVREWSEEQARRRADRRKLLDEITCWRVVFDRWVTAQERRPAVRIVGAQERPS